MDCDIYSLPLFSGGNKELIDNILQENPARHRLYAKGDIIALQGYVCKQLYLLCSGSAYARMVSEEGREFTLDTLSAPEVLASSFIFSTDGIFPVTIIAASDCSIWLISRHAAYPESRPDRHAELPQSHLRPQYVPEQPPRGVRPPDPLLPHRKLHREQRPDIQPAGDGLHPRCRPPVPLPRCLTARLPGHPAQNHRRLRPHLTRIRPQKTLSNTIADHVTKSVYTFFVATVYVVTFYAVYTPTTHSN